MRVPLGQQKSFSRFLGVVFLICGVILPFLIFFAVDREHLAGSLLGYLNCLIACFAIVYLASRQTVEAMIPLLVLPHLVFSWPLGNIYWAIRNPLAEMDNRPFSFPLLLLQDNVRLQTAVLLFLVIYLVIVLPAARRKGPVPTPYVANYRRWALAVVILNIVLVSPLFLAQMAGFSRGSVVIANTGGVYYYSSGLLFVAGVLVLSLTRWSKILLVAYFGIGMLLSAAFSGRGLIARPILAFLAGVFFLSPLSGKRKVILVAILAFVLPWYALIGQTTRMVFNKNRGGDLKARLQVLKNWQDYQAMDSPLDAIFGRLHWTGGHSILSETPSRVRFFEFNAGAYGKEILESLIPGRIYYNPHYRGTTHLLRYGHLISDENSVEVSMIGHFYMLGGWVPVAVGAACIGLLHVFVMGYLRRTWRRSALKALTIMSILAPLQIVFFGDDPINHFRAIVWYWAFAWLLYQFLRIVTQADVPQDFEEIPALAHGRTAFAGWG